MIVAQSNLSLWVRFQLLPLFFNPNIWAAPNYLPSYTPFDLSEATSSIWDPHYHYWPKLYAVYYNYRRQIIDRTDIPAMESFGTSIAIYQRTQRATGGAALFAGFHDST